MANRELPVLNFAAYRKYPTKLDQQEFDDDEQVCYSCLSGACCSNQEPIYLSAFDVFRLAASFDMSPARFMLTFTQDQFEGEPADYRRKRNNDPNDSVVTWLRRRTNSPMSPCIFLKYIREADGTPRRICSVHEARPLSCREFYFSTCRVRGTGEVAALLAEGFENIRDGKITDATVDANLKRIGRYDPATATLNESMEYFFWAEMKCAVNMDQSNVEGAKTYDMSSYQDPIDEKLNRLLSTKNLRFEEWYGPKPRDEQLMPYKGGLSFAGSAEYDRIMKVVSTTPSTGLFSLGSYPHRVGVRTLMPGVKHSERFGLIPDTAIASFLRNVPAHRLFPRHDLSAVRRITLRSVYSSVLKGFNHLIQFADDVIEGGLWLEYFPPGTLESELLEMFVNFETSLNPFIAHNAYVQLVKNALVDIAIERLDDDLQYSLSPDEFFRSLRLLVTMQAMDDRESSTSRTRLEAIDHRLRRALGTSAIRKLIECGNPVVARWAARKSLQSQEPWARWSTQIRLVHDVSLAALVRFDEVSFYARAIDELEKLPFDLDHADQLCDIVGCLKDSLTSSNRIAYGKLPHRKSAVRLASYGAGLWVRMQASKGGDIESESAIKLLSALTKGLGSGYNHDRSFGVMVARLLETQLSDGSWKTAFLASEAPTDQGEYLRMQYRPTWTAIDALRPLRSDVLVRENAELGLI